jgi:hypothetical protein
MTETNWVLPFITKTANETDLSFQAELACVVCLAETQRRKPGLLRDRSEKTAFIAKVYYPFWLIPNETTSILVNGLNNSPYTFTFNEPTKTQAFLEAVNQNTTDTQKLLEALQTQTKDTTTPTHQTFPALVNDKELLTFLPEYLNNPAAQKGGLQENALIPPEVDEAAAYKVAQNYVTTLRILNADTKGLQAAIVALKEQLDFHKKATEAEVTVVQQKSETAVAAIKPAVEKAVKKLTQKHAKAVVALQKVSDRKTASLDKKREVHLRKLSSAEQKKNALQNRIDAAKKRKRSSKSSASEFALKRYNRDIEVAKKEIKALAEEADALKKETDKALRAKDEEFEKAVAAEEAKITEITKLADAKVAGKTQQIRDLTAEAVKIISRFEAIIDELKRSAAGLRAQVEVGYKLDDPEMAVLVQVPIYLVKFAKGDEERYSLISPAAISQDSSMLGELKNLLKRGSDPKITALMHPASKALDLTLNSAVVGKLGSNPDFQLQINQICRSSNLINQDSFAQTLNEGLDEIQKQGYISAEEAASLCKSVVEG